MEFKPTEASIRAKAKKEVSEGEYEAETEAEIKVIDREGLCTALNNKYSKVKKELLLTMYLLGIGNKRDGYKVHFEDTFEYHQLDSDYEYSHMSEEELLAVLALHINPKYVIDVNKTIKYYKYNWWDF